MSRSGLRMAVLAGVVVMCGMVGSSFANSTISLNFNGLSHTANDTQVQSYIQSFLGAGEGVTVTGAEAGYGYTGDGHVVGCTTKNCNQSITLGGVNGKQGNFIINNPSDTTIDMQFTGVKFTSVSFDLEIFPDGTCPNGNAGCGANWPDFEFYANNNLVNTWEAVMPGTNGTDAYSPNSGSSKELAPQLITLHVQYNFPSGVTNLAFKDWPATIGVDNLTLTIPEPSSLLLLGSVLGAVGVLRRKFKG